MKYQQLGWIVQKLVVLAVATQLGRISSATAGDELQPRDYVPQRYSGLINDYTPSAAVVKGGPYEMRGKWAMELDERRGSAKFTAEMNMETSDYGITQGSVNKDDPTTRGAHTHHIIVTDGVISNDWQTSCPTFAPAVTGGFVVTGTAFVTGNGSPAPFGNPSPITLCILGGANVEFSNLTMTFGKPASTHFGIQAIHGVVVRCSRPWQFESRDCEVKE